MKNFVILIPSFNDWDNLNILIPKIHNILKNNDKNFSIIIINDSSTIKNNLSFKSKLCFEKNHKVCQKQRRHVLELLKVYRLNSTARNNNTNS